MEHERNRAKVECAVPLTPELQSRVQRRIERVYGPQMVTEFAYNPSLIGGMRVQVGSDVYDGSIISGLTALQRRLGVDGANATK